MNCFKVETNDYIFLFDFACKTDALIRVQEPDECEYTSFLLVYDSYEEMMRNREELLSYVQSAYDGEWRC